MAVCVCIFLLNSTWTLKLNLSIYADLSPSQTLAVCSILEEETDSGGLPDSWCCNL